MNSTLKTRIFMLILTPLFFVLHSCSTTKQGAYFYKNDIYTLQINSMTKDSVVKILGSPKLEIDTLSANSQKRKILRYFYAEKYKNYWMYPIVEQENNYEFLDCEFEKDTLIAWIYESTFENRRTNIDANAPLYAIIEGKSKKKEIEILFGKPAGIISPNSLLISSEYVPANTKDIWIYQNMIGDPLFFAFFKPLMLMFDSSGVLLSKVNLKDKKSKPKVDTNFINFKDLRDCENVVSFEGVKKNEVKKIILQHTIAFAMSSKDKKDAVDVIFDSENDMYKWLEKKYKSKYEVKGYNFKDSLADDIYSYTTKLVYNCLYNKTSPFTWNERFAEGKVADSTLMIVPVILYRMSGGEKSARYYIFVINSSGKILETRCMDKVRFDSWAGEVKTFIKDVEKSLPLLD